MKKRYVPSRIAIGCPNWIGDAVMATPALRAVRRGFPESHIALLLKPNISELLNGLPFFDEMIPIPADQDFRSLARLAFALRRKNFDLGLIFTHSFRSAMFARLAGVRRRVGYSAQGRGFLLTDALHFPTEGRRKRPQYMGDEYLGIVRYVGCKATDRSPELAFTSEAMARAEELLSLSGTEEERPLVGIAPGAFFGPSKLWYPERWAAVADALVDRSEALVFILTAPVERELYQQIESNMRTRPAPLRETPVSLDLLKAIVSELDLLLCTDCGVRHVAVAFGVPTVVIMGPTDPRYTQTECEKGVVVRKEVECSPCHKKVCPTDHRCMQRITPEMVLEAASGLLPH